MPSQSIARNQTYKEETKVIAQKWRDKIQGSQILNRLISYCEGNLELTSSQANTGLRLIGKILPDLASATVEVNHNHNLVDIHTLNARLAALGHDPETVFKRISTNQVIEAEPEKTIIESDSIQDPPTPDL